MIDMSSVKESRSLKFCIIGEKKGCCGTEVDCPDCGKILSARKYVGSFLSNMRNDILERSV